MGAQCTGFLDMPYFYGIGNQRLPWRWSTVTNAPFPLKSAGIVATLSGENALSVYTENRYGSEDLDFATTALLEDLELAIDHFYTYIVPTHLARSPTCICSCTLLD